MKKGWRCHPFYIKIRYGATQLLIPFIVFQLVRTLIFPTSFDVLLLLVLIGVYAALLLDWV
ncbi:hypothetical protein PP175_20370 [Aneurinibacillus sp. Ricciae_BoGa-3]|uniref:hypothetical protein n=1 Tax=Aneurinibacillus sp. Ricciae_BoGa-3 TaxID=3022697 RepID=UPI002340194B|nr:hypothetical protein [Aneurinibacillus sp. Ricciae_BoGa-3]WCK53662.1 hypothetical protein PP175_20370 [Aneurinibacillus sp. Ricciae_BoGa-3]